MPRLMMHITPKSAVVRARWLAELAAALDEAHRLTMRLAGNGCDTGEAATLHAHIRDLRAEVESLRRGNPVRTAMDDPILAYLAKWPGTHG